MRIKIGCVDGQTYEGDDVPESEMQDFLDSIDGKIGTGALEGTTAKTVDEFVNWYDNMLRNGRNGNVNTTDIIIYIDGQARTFAFDKIIWHEIVRD